MGDEGCLPLVAIFNMDVVISPVDIELGEYFGIFEFVVEARNEGKRVGILDGMFIQVVVILAQAKTAVLFF